MPWPIQSNGDNYAKISSLVSVKQLIFILCPLPFTRSSYNLFFYFNLNFFVIRSHSISAFLAENSYSHPSSNTLYSQICNTSSAPHIHHMSNPSQQMCCNDQDYHSNPGKSAFNTLYATPTATVCPTYGINHGTSTVNSSYPYDSHHHHHHHQHQHHMPHSKSFEHYHEPAKIVELHAMRHSFDNYKNYDCLDSAANNGHHARQSQHLGQSFHQVGANGSSSGGGVGGSGGVLNSSIPSNTYADPQHTYAHISDRNIDSFGGAGTCCHQSPHYDCLTAFGTRTSAIPKPATGHDYGNFNFQSK